jgi:hypothetical protein
MRRALVALSAALLLATTACGAAGGGGGAPKDAPVNATAAPSSTPAPVKSEPPDYGY